MADNNLYRVHPSVAYAQAIINNLPAKTGRSVDEWNTLIHQSGPEGEKERREWLKQDYKLGWTTAHMIAEQAASKGGEATNPEAYLQDDRSSISESCFCRD